MQLYIFHSLLSLFRFFFHVFCSSFLVKKSHIKTFKTVLIFNKEGAIVILMFLLLLLLFSITITIPLVTEFITVF